MEGLKVVCPSCRKVYHETTKHFDPDKSLRGHMVRLLDPWRKWGWCTFGDADNGLPPALAESERTYWSEMDCPGCGSPLAPSQTLMLRNQDDTDYVPPEPEPEPEPEASTETRDEAILRLRGEGLSYKAIGDKVGCSDFTARKVCKDAQTQS
jgi:hypothetical protein